MNEIAGEDKWEQIINASIGICFLVLVIILSDARVKELFSYAAIFLILIRYVVFDLTNRIRINFWTEEGLYVCYPFRLKWESVLSYSIKDISPNKKVDVYDWASKFSNTELQLTYQISFDYSTIYLRYCQKSLFKPVPLKIIRNRIESHMAENMLKFEKSKAIRRSKKKKMFFTAKNFPDISKVVSHFSSSLAVENKELMSIYFSIKLEISSKDRLVAFSIDGEKKDDLRFIKEAIKSLFDKPIFHKKETLQRNEPTDMRKILNLKYQPTSIHKSIVFSSKPANNEKGFVIGLQKKWNKNSHLSLHLKDFYQGGIISGSPGTGKTTLRLTIMKNMIEQGIKIIDIDLKGEASRLSFFREKGKVFVPKRNFHINIFEKPEGMKSQDFINFVYTGIIENFFSKEKLSANQDQILYSATKSTVLEKGSAYSFFQNILWHGSRLELVSGNYQESSSFSLLSKFQWMATNLREVCWVEESNFHQTDFDGNLFFDFSQLILTSPFEMVRFLIDMIFLRFKIHISKTEQINYSKEFIRHAIFVDEAQILLPSKNGKLSQLEEAITTLRYKGVAIIASGTSLRLMSKVLRNSGFWAKFRGSDHDSEISLGFHEKEKQLISSLPNYSFLVKSMTTGYQTTIGETIPFLDQPNGNTLISQKEKRDTKFLPNFELEEINIEFIRLCGIFGINLPNHRMATELIQLKDKIIQVLENEIFLPQQFYNLDEIISRHWGEENVNHHLIIYTIATASKSLRFLEGVPKRIKSELEDNKLRIVAVNLDNVTRNRKEC